MKKTIVVLFLAIAFVTPAFAEGRYATITTDTTETGHSNYTETDGSGGVFLIENPVTLTIEDNSSFSSNTASKYGGVIELNNSNAIVNIGSKVSFDKNKSGVGGAIDIYAGTVTIGYGTSFNENKATATESGSGGAIFNEGEIISDFVYFRINSAKDQGGAILNRGKITMKDASFWYNSAENEGGAIYNDSSEDISFGDTVSFSDNLAKFGGAIYNNRGNINIGNDVKFEFNDAKTGGAIYNKGTINIGNNAIFLRNMLPSYNSCGGAIYNEKNITIGRNAYFEQNTSDAGAGAIYNCSGGNITFLDGVIFKANSSKTGGGAIYNEGTMNFMAKTTNVEFEYNGLSLSGDGSSNAIYNSGGTVNLWASNNADIIFNDRILGSSGEININNRIFDLQENRGTGKIVLNEDMTEYKGNVGFYGGTIELGEDGTLFGSNNGITNIDVDNATIKMANGNVASSEFNNVSISNKLNFTVDADLENQTMDMIIMPSFSAGEGKLNIKEINVIKDSDEKITVDFSAINENTIINANKARSIFYSYDAKLDYGKIEYVSDGSLYSDVPGYYYTFTKRGLNPETIAGTIAASVGGYATQNVVANQAFASIDEKPERKLWLRPFVLNETTTIGGADVDNSLYGTLAGIDLPKGQDKKVSFYIGYAGSNQKVEEIKTNQTGYILGITGMILKNDWYLGATANAIINKASVDTDSQTNDIDTNMFTVAAKAGYNYEINKNWILEPNVTLMYGIVNCGSYETNKTKVDSQSINNILLEPQVKAKLQMEKGWQPYGLLGYTANLSGKTTVKTEYGDLDVDSIDGYVEYGAGVNKDFIDTVWSCYAQVTGRSGGRNGFAGDLGIKYKF